jgi:hypothetical protein
MSLCSYFFRLGGCGGSSNYFPVGDGERWRMISTWMMKLFLCEYVGLFIVACFEAKVGLALYMAGSAILTFGIILGMR